ncbi:type II toxin-antitoxin system RelE/ParE family toxin [Eilatimonas milleporae]|nr:type II toxin-antitoxin system RelE/ParE family toxin [Eilatimonas milleporae]
MERTSFHCSNMIKSFKCDETERLFRTGTSRRFSSLKKAGARKLDMLDGAHALEDLKSPPSNHLEKLKGDRAGQHGIRVNKQFRLCFVWRDKNAHDVETVDYH